MSAELQSKIDILKGRAEMLALARQFFDVRGVLEVDTPHLTESVIVDSYIDLIPATFRGKETWYLNSSPEMHMKQLLSAGMGDIYQLGHVFRDGELGRKHNPEFTMCEWYRIGFSYQEMIQETVEFIQTIVGKYPVRQISYRDAFLTYAGVDPYEGLSDEEADQLLVDVIEPKFQIPEYVVLTHFPPSRASLAKVVEHEGIQVAERFEIYLHGLELANGFNELSDPSEQLDRFEEENRKRGESHKPPLPISMQFIRSLPSLPPCAGVAVGFDRLLMLKYQASTIGEVLAQV